MLVSAIFIAGVALSSESKEKDARGKRVIDKQQPAAVSKGGMRQSNCEDCRRLCSPNRSLSLFRRGHSIYTLQKHSPSKTVYCCI